MPRQSAVPRYTLHRPSGQGRARRQGRDVYFGPCDAPTSRERYARFVAELTTRTSPRHDDGGPSVLDPDLPVAELRLKYLQFAQSYYGKGADEFVSLREALKPINQLYGTSRVRDFGPLALKPSSHAAIAQIIFQGEGCSPDAKDSHFAIFRRIRRGFLEESLKAEAAAETFAPVRPCIGNPVVFPSLDLASTVANPITDSATAIAVELFDSVYILMLRLLQYVFDSATNDLPTLQSFSRASLRIMTTVIKPFGEALAQLPAGKSEYGEGTAGPSFTIRRNVALPLDPPVAQKIVGEKLEQINHRLAQLLSTAVLPQQLHHAAQWLEKIKV